MTSLHKLHSHVHHEEVYQPQKEDRCSSSFEEVYQYKRFQKFSIKTLTIIACPNIKNKQKIGLGYIELNVKFGHVSICLVVLARFCRDPLYYSLCK